MAPQHACGAFYYKLLLVEQMEMKKNIFVVTVLVGLSSLMPLSSYAEDARVVEEDIRATCREESKNAESAEIYYEECVADKLQALRDKQSGSDNAAPEKS